MRRSAGLSLALVGAALVGAVTSIALRGDVPRARVAGRPPFATARIERSDLSSTALAQGSLGYVGSDAIAIPEGSTPSDQATAAAAVATADEHVATDQIALFSAQESERADRRAERASRSGGLDEVAAAVALAKAQLLADEVARNSASSALAQARAELRAFEALGCPAVAAVGGGGVGTVGAAVHGELASNDLAPTSSGSPRDDEAAGEISADETTDTTTTLPAETTTTTIAPSPPAAESGAVTTMTATAVTLSGSVDAGGLVTSYDYVFGLSASYGSTSQSASIPAGRGAVAVTVDLLGLRPGTTYDFRIVATNALGTTYGINETFTTSPSSCSVTVATVAADNRTLIVERSTVRADEAALRSARVNAASEDGGGAVGNVASDVATVATDRVQLDADAAAAAAAAHNLAVTDGAAANVGSTLTYMPAVGAVIRRGMAVYTLDNEPARLIFGTVVPWRSFELGMRDGPDVAELQANLIALGYGAGLVAGPHFDDATAAAIRRWQSATGSAPTGVERLGDVVVAPGPLRVSATADVAGQAPPPGSVVLHATSTARDVEVALNPNDSFPVVVGEQVEIQLPSLRTTMGVVTTVGPPPPSADTSSSSDTIEVTIRPLDVAATGTASGVSVQVSFTNEIARGVLVAPVAALLALAGGGYGVEVVEHDGVHDLVGVDTGTFAGGRVEISGSQIVAGTTVVVSQ